MDILKSIGKIVSRICNHVIASIRSRKAPKYAYAQTGRQIAEAKRYGRFIDGSAAYKKNLRQKKKEISQDRRDWDQFINNL